jgi:hypothetical protein
MPTRRPVAEPLVALWAQLYPCGLAHRCQRIRFDPEQGLLPRGIYAPPTLARVRLLVLAHNPGNPQPGELGIFRSAPTARAQVEVASALTRDSFVRALLPSPQRRRSPDHKPKRYHQRLLRVLMAALGDGAPLEPEAVLEQVVFSNLVKCQLLGRSGTAAPAVTLTNCTSTYLEQELALLPGVAVLAVGSPAQHAVQQLQGQGRLPSRRWALMRHPAMAFTDRDHASAVTALRHALGPTSTQAVGPPRPTPAAGPARLAASVLPPSPRPPLQGQAARGATTGSGIHVAASISSDIARLEVTVIAALEAAAGTRARRTASYLAVESRPTWAFLERIGPGLRIRFRVQPDSPVAIVVAEQLRRLGLRADVVVVRQPPESNTRVEAHLRTPEDFELLADTLPVLVDDYRRTR